MPRKQESQDTIAYRLAALLSRLNEGRKLDPQALADEFGVNLRTIQRDLNERLAFLEPRKESGLYSVDTRRLGLLSRHDVERFASLAGLHPRLSGGLLKDLIASKLDSLQLRGHEYEELSGEQVDAFQLLKRAIEQRQRVSFRYRKPEGEKLVGPIEPYKLVNQRGIWYLAACDAGAIKSYTFTKISAPLSDESQRFEPDAAVVARLEQEDSIWLNFKKTEVVFKVSTPAAGYFQRRKLVDGQKIEKQLEDGGLLISCPIAHPDQILPTLRYWLPHVRVVSPESLQQQLERQLREYLGIAG